VTTLGIGVAVSRTPPFVLLRTVVHQCGTVVIGAWLVIHYQSELRQKINVPLCKGLVSARVLDGSQAP